MRDVTLQRELDTAAAGAQYGIAQREYDEAYERFSRAENVQKNIVEKFERLKEDAAKNREERAKAHARLIAAKALCDEVHNRLTPVPVNDTGAVVNSRAPEPTAAGANRTAVKAEGFKLTDKELSDGITEGLVK